MEVEHVLPAGLPVRLQERHAVRRQAVAKNVAICRTMVHTGVPVLGVEIPDVDRVDARDHERVALGRRIDVQERQRALRLGDRVDGLVARDDRAEDAVRAQ